MKDKFENSGIGKEDDPDEREEEIYVAKGREEIWSSVAWFVRGKRSGFVEPLLVESRSDRVVKEVRETIGFLRGVRHVRARVHRCRGLRYTSPW